MYYINTCNGQQVQYFQLLLCNRDRKSLLNGQLSCFVSRRSQVQISAQRAAILIEDFCGFPESDAKIVP